MEHDPWLHRLGALGGGSLVDAWMLAGKRAHDVTAVGIVVVWTI